MRRGTVLPRYGNLAPVDLETDLKTTIRCGPDENFG